MTRNEIARLSAEDPQRLVAVADDPATDEVDLTWIAEALGDYTGARDCLMRLTRHASPIVREGAIYGLERMTFDAEAVARWREMAVHDASPGVRSAAADAVMWAETMQ